MKHLLGSATAFAVLALGAPALRTDACGPDFPNAYLTNSLEELSTLPALSFERELARLVPSRAALTRSDAAADLDAEKADVASALRRAGLPAAEVERLMRTYDRLKPPAALPREYHLYARGAAAWHSDCRDEAIAAWRELLNLPEGERRDRTVWAAFMLGRALSETAPNDARVMFQVARDAAAAGFSDSQHLAPASVGWTARASLCQRDYPAALHGYLEQYALGDASAIVSLQITLRRTFGAVAEDDEATDKPAVDSAPAYELERIARDDALRPVVTAWFAARGGPGLRWGQAAQAQFGRWIGALRDTATLPPSEADRWSWAAYQNGRWDDARALAARAPADAPASEWVRAMLLLRAGFLEDATVHLAGAARAFAVDPSLDVADNSAAGLRLELQPFRDQPRQQLAGARGVLALQREQYTEAFRLFLQADHWADAAYVAERVLTLDELRSLVNAEFAPPAPADESVTARQARELRHLLARRLVRAKRFDDALAYFPADVASRYRSYVADVRFGFDAAQPERPRAEALWRAAQVLRDHGMELQGAELAPDFNVWGGSFQWPNIAAERGLGSVADDEPFEPCEPVLASAPETILAVHATERERVKASRVPLRRFHYRDRAAQLAWLAAGLSPNNDELTAEMLNTAGNWIAPQYPEEADLFYRALVVRCPNTPLGHQAAAKHWLVRGSAEPNGKATTD